MKYEFKIEIPVLNGLMQYPIYIQRGKKIIPLTKPEIQKELESLSYRKLDVDIPYKKDNIFNNIGDNIHRKPNNQKWYDVKVDKVPQIGLPLIYKYKNRRSKG